MGDLDDLSGAIVCGPVLAIIFGFIDDLVYETAKDVVKNGKMILGAAASLAANIVI